MVAQIAYPDLIEQFEEDNADIAHSSYLVASRDFHGQLFEMYMRDEFFPKVNGAFNPSCDPDNFYPANGFAYMYSGVSDTTGVIWNQTTSGGFCRGQGGYYASAQEVTRLLQTTAYTNKILDPATYALLDDRNGAGVSNWLVLDMGTTHGGFDAELGVATYRAKDGWHPRPGGRVGRALGMLLPYGWVGGFVGNSDGNTNRQAFDGILSAFFDATRDIPQVISREAMLPSTFQETATTLRAFDMEVTWLDLYDIDGQPYVNAVFGPSPAPAAGLLGLNSQEYQDFLDEWVVNKGYSVQQVESYIENGKVRYAALISSEDRPPQVAYHGFGPIDHLDEGVSLQNQDYVPINLSIVSRNGNRYYTALYEKRDVDFEMRSQLTAEEYNQAFADLGNEGFTVVSLNAYHHNGTRFYAAIFHRTNTAVSGSHEDDRDAYRTNDAAWLNSGRSPKIITGVDSLQNGATVNERHRFGAIWE